MTVLHTTMYVKLLPRAVDLENVFTNGERTVIPNKQETKAGIGHSVKNNTKPKLKEANKLILSLSNILV